MPLKQYEDVQEIFAEAIRFSIAKIGLDRFRQTSFFGTNECLNDKLEKKLAA